MASPVGGLQSCIRTGKALLLRLLTSKDKPLALRALLKHVRHRNIKFVQRGGYKTFVMNRSIVLDGLTRRLKGALWRSSTAPKTRQGDTKTQLTASSGGCYFHGVSRKHGLRVHSDFARLVKCMTRQTTTKKGGSQNVGKVDACAFRMFMHLIQKGIVPVICEMAVYDEYLRIGTAIDCVAYDTRTNRVIAIEIKTGHLAQRNYSVHNGRTSLMAPLDDVPDTPLNRAAIQLLTTLIMLRRRYNVHVHGGLILRPLGATGLVQTYELPPSLLNISYQNKIYLSLKKHVDGTTDTSRSYNIPVGKRTRDEFYKDQSAQRARETIADPKPTVFWHPIAGTLVRHPAAHTPAVSCTSKFDDAPSAPDEDIGASSLDHFDGLFDDGSDGGEIAEIHPAPYEVTVDPIPVATEPVHLHATHILDCQQETEFSWESFFGRTPPASDIAPSLAWDDVLDTLKSWTTCNATTGASHKSVQVSAAQLRPTMGRA